MSGHVDDLLAPDGRYDPCSVRGLGRTQVLVLRLLALQHGLSARDLAYHWPSLTESSARSAINRLGDRGLVDVFGWEGMRGARTYGLTKAGRRVEAALNVEDETDE